MKKLKIKKGATVQITAGDDKGKSGSVLEVDPYAMKIKVSGVRIQTRRDKKENTLYKEEGFLDYSNVKLMDGSSSTKKKKAKKKAKKKTTKKKATAKAEPKEESAPV